MMNVQVTCGNELIVSHTDQETCEPYVIKLELSYNVMFPWSDCAHVEVQHKLIFVMRNTTVVMYSLWKMQSNNYLRLYHFISYACDNRTCFIRK